MQSTISIQFHYLSTPFSFPFDYIEGTSGALLSENTAYDAIGHCYFLEDGVEEENILSYNLASHIHALGPYINPSINANKDGWQAQQLSDYSQTENLTLPSDMSASGFYITNAYNDIVGNAASGGWTGFALPTLPLPVKMFQNEPGIAPGNRYFRSPFRGNSAHSSGFWWDSAGVFYIGGLLTQSSSGVLTYNAGRRY